MSPRPAPLSFLLLFAAPSGQAFELSHVPITNALEGASVRIEATFSGTETVTTANLFYRKTGGAYVPTPMTVSGNRLGGEIPPEALSPPSIEYFVQVRTADGVSSTFPQNALTTPLRIAVLAAGGRFEAAVAHPEPDSEIDQARPEIRIAFTRAEGGLDPGSLHIFIDGVDDTEAASIAEDQVSLMPTDPLKPGLHWVNVIAQSRSGTWAPALTFSFKVTKARLGWPVSMHGTLEFESAFVSVPEAPADEGTLAIPKTPNGYAPVLRLDASGTFGPDRLRIRALTNPIDRGEQPANDSYLAELSGEGHRLALGDTTVQSGEFAARYLRLRGADGELAAGPVRLKAFGGRTHRAIERPQFRSGTFERTVAGGRAGLHLGGADFGGQYVSGGDDEGSLPAGALATPARGSASFLDASLPLPLGLRVEGEYGRSRFERDLRTGVETKGTGWRTRLRGGAGQTAWSFGYRHIDPDFASIANPFVQSDVRGFDGEARVSLGGARVSASGSSYRDNVEGRKTATLRTHRANGSVSLPPKPGRPGLSLGGQYVGQSTDPGAAFEVRTRTLGANAGVQFALDPLSLGLNGSYSAFRDLSSAGLSSDSDSYSGSVNGFWRSTRAWVSASTGATLVEIRAAGSSSRFYFANASSGMQWTPSVSSQVQLNGSRGLATGGTLDNLQWSAAAETSWTMKPFRWKAAAEYVRSRDRVVPADSFTETEFALSLQLSF